MSNLNIVKGGVKLRARVDFGEFHEALAGDFVKVWLNPSADFQAEWTRNSIDGQASAEELAALVAEMRALADAGEDDAPPEMQARYEGLLARNNAINDEALEQWAVLWDCEPEEARYIWTEYPELYLWLGKRTLDRIREYREGSRAKVRSG